MFLISKDMAKRVFAVMIAFAFIVSLVGPALATETPENGKSGENNAAPSKLTEFIEIALKDNPRLKAARLEWKWSTENYPQATSYDDPEFSYTHPIDKIETRLGPQERILKLSQKIPFPGKLTLKGKIVKKDIEIARTRYEKLLRDLTTEVKKSFFELYYIDHAIELAKENKTVLDYFFDVSKTNYGLDVSELDELVRAEKLAAKGSFDLIMLKDMRASVVSRLNSLLNRAPLTVIGELEEPTFKPFDHSPEDLYKWALTNYEALKIAGLKIEKSKLETKLSKYSYLPNFRIGFNYSEIGTPGTPVQDGGRDAVSATLGVTIPIWFGKNKAVVRQSHIGMEKALIEKQAVANEIQNEVKKVYYNLIRAERLVNLYGDSLVPEAQETLDFAEARYKTGKEMLGRLLETQSLSINFRMIYYRAFADYMGSIAELERLTATDLGQ